MRIGFGTICLMLTALTASGSQAARKERTEAFDLQCKGMQNRWTGGNPDAWSDRLRIDLTAKRWCRGECMTPAPIEEIMPNRFRMLDSRAESQPAETEMMISRTDGSILERVRMGAKGQWATIVEGFCTRDRFSGFQPTKF